MTTENWREELIREMPFLSEQSLGTIKNLLSKERNAVLSGVKKEVEELNKHYFCGACAKGVRSLSHTHLCGYKKEISTLLENLKV